MFFTKHIAPGDIERHFVQFKDEMGKNWRELSWQGVVDVPVVDLKMVNFFHQGMIESPVVSLECFYYVHDLASDCLAPLRAQAGFYDNESVPQPFEQKMSQVFVPALNDPAGLNGRVPDLVIFERSAILPFSPALPSPLTGTRLLLSSASLGTSSSSPTSLETPETPATKADRWTTSSSRLSEVGSSRSSVCSDEPSRRAKSGVALALFSLRRAHADASLSRFLFSPQIILQTPHIGAKSQDHVFSPIRKYQQVRRILLLSPSLFPFLFLLFFRSLCRLFRLLPTLRPKPWLPSRSKPASSSSTGAASSPPSVTSFRTACTSCRAQQRGSGSVSPLYPPPMFSFLLYPRSADLPRVVLTIRS